MHYRRIARTFAYRFVKCWTSAWKFFIIASGIAGTVITFVSSTGTKVSLVALMWTTLIVVLVSFGYGLINLPTRHISDEIVIEDESEARYQLAIEDESTCQYFNRQTTNFFVADCVEDHVAEAWRKQCPNGFFYLSNEASEPCAAACLFALEDSFMKQFLKGRISEDDLRASDILNFEDSKKSDHLYLAAIIVCNPETAIGHRRAAVMVWGIIQFLRKFYCRKKAKILYAVPVNGASENLVRRFGFALVTPAEQRKDGHPLYSFTLSKENLKQAIQRVGDYSAICEFRIGGNRP